METKEQSQRPYKRDRAFVIIEAALEYFISICVTSTLLTAILNHMEVSASLQGIVSAITSLACSVQLIAVFAVRKSYPSKFWISFLDFFSNLLYTLLYCIPLLDLSKEIKITAFILLLLFAHACKHFRTPAFVNWQYSLVEDNHRGIFTANKEIVSLISGMLFSQGAGMLIDYYMARDNMTACFIILAITITVLSSIRLFVMLITREPKPSNSVASKSFRSICRTVFGNAALRRVLVFDALFAISGVSLHFYSAYLTLTFEMSYTYLTAISVMHALFRAVVSRFLGRLADRKSWAYMLRGCLLVLSVGYAVFILCSPKSVIWLYPVFSLCYAFSLGGTNAGRNNLCMDYVAHEDRRYILGVQHAISGIAAFGATLIASAVVEYIEQSGNRLLGFSVYPQQILFAFSALLLLFLALFLLPRLERDRLKARASD